MALGCINDETGDLSTHAASPHPYERLPRLRCAATLSWLQVIYEEMTSQPPTELGANMVDWGVRRGQINSICLSNRGSNSLPPTLIPLGDRYIK